EAYVAASVPADLRRSDGSERGISSAIESGGGSGGRKTRVDRVSRRARRRVDVAPRTAVSSSEPDAEAGSDWEVVLHVIPVDVYRAGARRDAADADAGAGGDGAAGATADAAVGAAGAAPAFGGHRGLVR